MRFQALTCAAGFGLLAVIFGAFGAHALKAHLSVDALVVWQTAVDYHFYHTLALLFVGCWLNFKPDTPLIKMAGVFFSLGIIIFCGSLYVLAISGIKKLGMITPIGGLLFIAGWVCILITGLKNKSAT